MLLLITGAAGFIGARTAQLALDAGHEVVGLDNLNDYYDPRLALLDASRESPAIDRERLKL